MNGTDVGSITVSFAMNENEYARYAAAIKRRQPRWANFLAFVLVLFSAIPVALTFRFFARQSYVAAISDEIGLVSLLSYMVGAYAMMTAAFVIQRRTSKRTVAAVRAYGTVTAVLDVAGVALTRQMESRWAWAAIQDFSREGGLLLLWIGPSAAIAIPSRSFETASACDAAAAFIRAAGRGEGGIASVAQIAFGGSKATQLKLGTMVPV